MAIANWIRRELKRNYTRATQAGRKAEHSEPRARSARYDAKRNLIVVDLTNGCEFAFPPGIAQGLENATPELLAEVDVTPMGFGLHWEKLDADLGVPHLIMGIFGSKAWMRELARRGGSVTSAAKARASRENGKKGGRPRRTQQSKARVSALARRAGRIPR